MPPLSHPAALPVPLARRLRLKSALWRLATACAAVVGFSAMAFESSADMRPRSDRPAFEESSYLYGESAVTGTIGAVYFVFQVQADQLSGAIYQPASSFDCVFGQVGDSQLNLMVTNTYDQTTYPYTVAFSPAETVIASARGVTQPPTLNGMQAIHTLSDLDRRLLEICNR